MTMVATPKQQMVELELTMMEAWFDAVKLAIGTMQCLAAMQLALLPRRLSYHRWHDVPAFYADMMGHYGRRARDVDVKHMR